MTPNSLNDSVTLFRVNDSMLVSIAKLKEILPNIEVAIFFGKVYDLDFRQLSDLLTKVFNTTVVDAFAQGGHSADLQDYLVDVIPDHLAPEAPPAVPDDPSSRPSSELLVQLFESAAVQIAQSIKDVGNHLASVMNKLPSKHGQMVFSTMMRVNRNRPTIGVYGAGIHHTRVNKVGVVLDVSGSMSESTVRGILTDVMALTYDTNAHLITVSNEAHHWEPGAASMQNVLDTSAYGGTHYEQLAPLFNQDWDTVVTIADYDSSRDAKRVLGLCSGRIGRLLDISLVNRPTHLGECLGQLADTVEPLLVGTGVYVPRY